MVNLFLRWPGAKERAFTLSYDDGVIQDVRLTEMMKERGLKGTLNIPSSYLGDEHVHHVSYGVLRDMISKGVIEVAGHGETHPFYAKMDTPQVLKDLLNDRAALERETGGLVRGFALPNGSYNADTIECLRLAGFVYSRTTKSTKAFSLPENFLEWHPTCHQLDPALDSLCDEFFDPNGRYGASQLKYSTARLFYVWGHAYEMDRAENWSWEKLDALFDKVAGRDDVWYATNMEIYDYVRAFRSLIQSADGSFIYNPGTLEVFAQAYFPGQSGVHLFSVKPGETLRFADLK
ncbi:MAG: polysaccharide deacetylase family protein [Clostridia bacterium]|nr:polysaccharide deacetylase family protein [Clostridia bacterium]